MSTSPSNTIAFTVASAASACDLPRKTIDYAIKQGDLAAMKSGKRLIVLREDLQAWLARCKEKGRIPTNVSQEAREQLAALNRSRRSSAT